MLWADHRFGPVELAQILFVPVLAEFARENPIPSSSSGKLVSADIDTPSCHSQRQPHDHFREPGSLCRPRAFPVRSGSIGEVRSSCTLKTSTN
jgi:hypothetical protein